MTDTIIDMTDDKNILELYHRISENEEKLNNILTVTDEDNNTLQWDELDIKLIEKLEWEPTEEGNFNFTVNGHEHTVEVEHSIFNDSYLIDSWKDGEINRPRTNEEDGNYTQSNGDELTTARYRPHWELIDSENHNATGLRKRNNRLEWLLDESTSDWYDVDYLTTETDFTIGSWKIDFEMLQGRGGSSGSYNLYWFLMVDNKEINWLSNNVNGWALKFNDGGYEQKISLVRVENGDRTDVIEINMPDGMNTYEITRNKDGHWSLYINDDLKDTYEDTFLPTVNYTRLGARTNNGRWTSEFAINNLSIGDK